MRIGTFANAFLAVQHKDVKAQQFLEELDNNPEIGGLIDATSNYENESSESEQPAVSFGLLTAQISK